MTTYARGEPKNTTVDRALRVLEAFVGRDGDLTLADLSAELNLDKSVIHRILATLVRRRFIEQDPVSKGYRVGLRMWEIGQRYVTRSPLEDRAVRALEKVVEAHPYATGYFSTLDMTHTVVLRTVRGPGPINIHIDPGSRLPAASTATGRCMLACLTEEEILELLPDLEQQLADSEGEKRFDLREELEIVARQGYSVNRGGYFPGIGTVAIPIRHADGSPAAALSVDFLITSDTGSLWDDLPKELNEAVEGLEALVRSLPDRPDT